MKVWIDQDLCTGDGLCEEIAPAVFTLLDDGLAYVKESDQVRTNRAVPRAWRLCLRTSRKLSPKRPRSAPGSASSSSRAKRRRRLGTLE
jgi:ferredoxin